MNVESGENIHTTANTMQNIINTLGKAILDMISTFFDMFSASFSAGTSSCKGNKITSQTFIP